jgi:cysteine synthase A
MKTPQPLLVAKNISDLIGNTPLLRIPSLSQLTGSQIFLKCEQLNPGGSIKDRAALQMVLDALEAGKLKKGMTIVEGTAGNTGIGLALVAKALGFECLAVMPNDQTIEKQRMIELHGAKLKLVDPVPFKNENHFYHTARRLAEEDPKKYWWANQFENLSNFKAHYTQTGPEIYQQLQGKIDVLVSVAGTGGTIGGNSAFLKEKIPHIQVALVDPEGSGLCSYIHTGEFKSQGRSITEGIGIMRLVANFAQAKVDDAFTLTDQDVVTVAQYIRNADGILLGSSTALNVAGALKMAVQRGPGNNIVTFYCDLGERSFSKLYNPEYLQGRGLDITQTDIQPLIEKYRAPRASL